MPTYAAYIRVSSDEQRDRQTIKTQLEAINHYARANNIRIKHVFADDGISGSLPVSKRPEGSRLLDKAEAGDFDTLLVFRMDRISRDALEMLRVFRQLENQGITIKSITEPFDTRDPAGKLFITVLGGMAQLEKDALKSRSFSGMKRGAGEGRWMGGRAPFGYQIESGKLVPNRTEAEVVREAFELYLSGLTSQKIADAFNAKGIPVPAAWRGLNKGAVWKEGTVCKILRNESYTGAHRWNKVHTPHEEGVRGSARATHEREQIVIYYEPIVSQQDFLRVQERLDKNIKFSPRNSHREYTLRGLVYCGACGLLCVGGGGDYANYSCTASNRRKGTVCGQAKVKACPLEEQIWNDMVELAQNPDTLLASLRTEQREKRKLIGARSKDEELLQTLKGFTEERSRIIRQMRKGTITEDEAEASLKEIEQEQDTIEKQREKIRRLIRSEERLERSLDNLSKALADIKRNAKTATPQEQGEILRSLIDQIIVTPNSETDFDVEIKYLLPES